MFFTLGTADETEDQYAHQRDELELGDKAGLFLKEIDERAGRQALKWRYLNRLSECIHTQPKPGSDRDQAEEAG